MMYNIYVEKPIFKQNKAERIRDCFQDYYNEINGPLNILFMGNGIEGVRDYFRSGNKILSVQEYLAKYKAEGRNVLSEEEQKNLVFMDKSQRLNKLVKEINTFGENIDLPNINKTIEEAKKLVYRK